MLMNKRKYHRLFPLLFLTAVSMAVLAQDTETETAEPAVPSTDQPEQVSPEAAEPVSATSEAEANTPAAEAASPTTLKDFKPTDKIEADSAVSFPIDI